MTLFVILLCISAAFTVAWLYQEKTKEADIVDACWTLCLGLTAVCYGLLYEGDYLRKWLVCSLVLIWSLRLFFHLLFDRVMQKGEDGRYANLRRHWDKHTSFKFFLLFQAQAILVLLLSSAYFAAITNPAPAPTAWDLIAVGVFVISIGCEALADRQLRSFRANPANKGKTCRIGLWRYSRHPNYFFEWLHWLAYVFFSVGSGLLWLSLLSPLIMLALVLKVSGVPHTEAQALRSRGDDYKEYQRTTNVFFPWRPKA